MFRRILRFFFLLTVVSCLAAFKHPYHLAVTTVVFTKASSELTIEYKAFYHDFEEGVNKLHDTQIDIKNHSDVNKRDQMVYDYLSKSFSISSGEKALLVSQNGISFKDEYIFVKYKVTGFKGGLLTIKNSALYEIEKTQTNLFHFKSGKLKTTKKTVNPDYKVEFTFE